MQWFIGRNFGCRHTEQTQVKREAESGLNLHRLRSTKDCWQPPGTRKSQRSIFAYNLQRKHGQANTLILHSFLASLNIRGEVSVVLNHSVCGYLWQQTWETSIVYPVDFSRAGRNGIRGKGMSSDIIRNKDGESWRIDVLSSSFPGQNRNWGPQIALSIKYQHRPGVRSGHIWAVGCVNRERVLCLGPSICLTIWLQIQPSII